MDTLDKVKEYVVKDLYGVGSTWFKKQSRSLRYFLIAISIIILLATGQVIF
jgi:hypothetical protein